MNATLARISDAVNLWVMRVSGALLVAMILVSLANAASNIVTGRSLTWTMGVNKLMFAWVALLCVTVAFKYGEHIAMNGLLRLSPTRLQKLLVAADYVVLIVIAILFIWIGIDYTVNATHTIMISPGLRIAGSWAAASIPAAGAIMLIHLLCGPAALENWPRDGDPGD